MRTVWETNDSHIPLKENQLQFYQCPIVLLLPQDHCLAESGGLSQQASPLVNLLERCWRISSVQDRAVVDRQGSAYSPRL
jgi:hypothetical protein